MRKGIMLGVMLALFLATAAYAHLTGAFADFLVAVNDEGTTEKLKQEVEKTKREINDLQPRLQKLQAGYATHQQEAVDKLQLYSDLGLDIWMDLLMQAEKPVDIMGSQWLIERNLDAYLHDLDKLYAEFQQVRTTKETLEGHQRLLAIIEENLQARKQFLAENPELPLDQLANYLDIDWMSEVEPQLLAILAADRGLTEAEAQRWAEGKGKTAPYSLEEAWLNKQSRLLYFFRSDHVYTVYKKPGIHVILIGQVLRGSGNAAELVFEAGFFNGFLMPDTLINELHGFRIPYDLLHRLGGVSPTAYLQQANGALLLREQD